MLRRTLLKFLALLPALPVLGLGEAKAHSEAVAVEPPKGKGFMWTPSGPVEIKDDDRHIVKYTVRNIRVVDGVWETKIAREATIQSFGWDPGDGEWEAGAA